MDGRLLRERLTELVKTIPLDVGENPFANVMFHVDQLEHSIQQIVQRSEYQRAKQADKDQKLAMDRRAKSNKVSDAAKAKRKAAAERELAGHNPVSQSSVAVKHD